MKRQTFEISATELAAQCSAVLDEVASTGRILIVTKHGRPVAKLSSIEKEDPPSLIGSLTAELDIESPTGNGEIRRRPSHRATHALRLSTSAR